jgi:retron-type reverse transcriptase
VSYNDTRTCWVLKCDIRKFFANIDHKILAEILKQYIPDSDIIWLTGRIIDSFSTSGKSNVGLPLGNLTSQLLVNIYMNKFDQFMKHGMKVKHYVRYADDFVVLSRDKDILLELLPKIGDFLNEELKLELHPDKVSIKTLASGIDFLGWVHFPDHRVLRTATKRRIMRRIARHPAPETADSYIGLLRHGNAYKIMGICELLNKRGS